MSLLRRFSRRNELSEEELRKTVANASEVLKTLETPGWKIIEAEIQRKIGLETRVLIQADPEKLMSVTGVAAQQYVRGMEGALAVTEDLVSQGTAAMERLATGKFRG